MYINITENSLCIWQASALNGNHHYHSFYFLILISLHSNEIPFLYSRLPFDCFIGWYLSYFLLNKSHYISQLLVVPKIQHVMAPMQVKEGCAFHVELSLNRNEILLIFIVYNDHQVWLVASFCGISFHSVQNALLSNYIQVQFLKSSQ